MTGSGERVLTRRELGRATLARQFLLDRAALPVAEAIESVAGLQAQVPNPPYIGLWTRLAAFRRDDLTTLIADRRVVRAAGLRSTLHLFTARDYLAFRPALQPALVRALRAFFGPQVRGLDADRLVAAARAHLEGGPKPWGELRAFLTTIEPDRDPEALAYVIRSHLPLVQVPPGGTWGAGGSPAYALAEGWLDAPLAADDGPQVLIRRYLAAFGPATVADVQAWAGITGLKGAIEALKPELRSFRDERGKELVDLPDAPLPDADTPAPPRFIPEYDNLVLAHADRTRIIADEGRPRVFLTAARVRATFLLDGLVAGTWKVERTRGAATLVIEPFAPLPRAARTALAAEGERLLAFIEDAATTRDLRFAEPG